MDFNIKAMTCSVEARLVSGARFEFVIHGTRLLLRELEFLGLIFCLFIVAYQQP